MEGEGFLAEPYLRFHRALDISSGEAAGPPQVLEIHSKK
jgi:hypothetical protein